MSAFLRNCFAAATALSLSAAITNNLVANIREGELRKETHLDLKSAARMPFIKDDLPVGDFTIQSENIKRPALAFSSHWTADHIIHMHHAAKDKKAFYAETVLSVNQDGSLTFVSQNPLFSESVYIGADGIYSHVSGNRRIGFMREMGLTEGADMTGIMKQPCRILNAAIAVEKLQVRFKDLSAARNAYCFAPLNIKLNIA